MNKTSSFNKKPKGKWTLRSLLDGTILTQENTVKLLPFVFYLTLLAIFYIANTYYAERTVREIQLTKKELKELRNEHITIKSELMFKSKPSEVAKRLKSSGIKESVVPPYKIYIKKDSLDIKMN